MTNSATAPGTWNWSTSTPRSSEATPISSTLDSSLLLPVDPGGGKDDDPETRIVEPGETLSEIALEEYDDATRYPEIFQASRKTVQPDGHRLTEPDLIRPGWKLTIPSGTNKKPAKSAVIEEEPEPEVDAPSAPSTPTPLATPSEVGTPSTTHAEAVPDNEEEADQVSAAPGWLLPGLTGAGAVLAGSLFLVVRAHRRTQLRFRRPGHLIAPLPVRLADVDKTMHEAGAPTATQLERLDALLRALEAFAREAGSRPPALISIELGSSEVTLHLAQEASLPAPWTGSATTWSTHLPEEVEDVDDTAPYPLLVTVGSDASGHIWLVNLEELRRVRMTGDGDRALAFARHLTAELALAPWASLVTTDTLGLASELAEIDTLRHRHHADGDTSFIDLLVRDLTGTDGPDREPDSYRALIVMDSSGSSEATARVNELLRVHHGRPGVAVLVVGGPNEIEAVEFDLTHAGRLLIPSLGLDLEPVGMTPGEATACTAIVDLTRDAENVPVPLDEEAEGDWRAVTDVGGALRPELTEPRPVGPAGESSLLPASTDAYATAAATTAEDVETLAPHRAPRGAGSCRRVRSSPRRGCRGVVRLGGTPASAHPARADDGAHLRQPPGRSLPQTVLRGAPVVPRAASSRRHNPRGRHGVLAEDEASLGRPHGRSRLAG